MYLISVILFLILAIAYIFISCGAVMPFDFVSILSILLLVIPIMAACGLWKDFFAGLSFSMRKTCPADKTELLRARTSVVMLRSLLILSGALTTLLSIIALLRHLDDSSSLGPNLVVALLSLSYAVIAGILLLPVQIRLQLLIDDCV